MANLLSWLAPQTEEKAHVIVAEGPVVAAEKRTIVFLYDQSDRELWSDLAAHIGNLVLRFQSHFDWKYYTYEQFAKEDKRENFLLDLQEKTFLFVPCISPTFLTHYWSACNSDARIAQALTRAYTQPIPLRATHFVAQSILPKPLAAYSTGHERDEACVHILVVMEQKLLAHLQESGQPSILPMISLAETTKTLLLR